MAGSFTGFCINLLTPLTAALHQLHYPHTDPAAEPDWGAVAASVAAGFSLRHGQEGIARGLHLPR